MNKRRNSGSTALHVACHEGQIEVVKKLLEVNSDINILRDNGQSCLYIACDQGNLQLVKFLLQQQSITIHTPISPLHVTAQRGNLSIFKELINNGGDINFKCASGDYPLLVACQHSRPKIVSYLIENFLLSLSSSCETPSEIIHDHGSHSQPLSLDDQEIHPDDSILIVEVNEEKEKVKKRSLDLTVCREEDGRNALSVACTQNCISIVKKLILRAKMNCNYAENGELPLLLSIISSSSSIFDFLIHKFVFY